MTVHVIREIIFYWWAACKPCPPGVWGSLSSHLPLVLRALPCPGLSCRSRSLQVPWSGSRQALISYLRHLPSLQLFFNDISFEPTACTDGVLYLMPASCLEVIRSLKYFRSFYLVYVDISFQVLLWETGPFLHFSSGSLRLLQPKLCVLPASPACGEICRKGVLASLTTYTRFKVPSDSQYIKSEVSLYLYPIILNKATSATRDQAD